MTIFAKNRPFIYKQIPIVTLNNNKKYMYYMQKKYNFDLLFLFSHEQNWY